MITGGDRDANDLVECLGYVSHAGCMDVLVRRSLAHHVAHFKLSIYLGQL